MSEGLCLSHFMGNSKKRGRRSLKDHCQSHGQAIRLMQNRKFYLFLLMHGFHNNLMIQYGYHDRENSF